MPRERDDGCGGAEGKMRRRPHTRLPGFRSHRPRLRTLGAAFASLTLVLAAACSDDGDTTPATPSVTAMATQAATVVGSLRDVDFEAFEVQIDLINRAGGGEIHAERVVFVDLTDDGREEAVVVVESGGTAGDLGVAIYRLGEGGPEVVFFQALAGHVEVRFDLVVTQVGVYGMGDAQCCPSQLRERVYGWRDGQFEVVSDQTVDNQ
jgi:hypothetical protein